MGKAVTSLKYTVAVIVFVIVEMICAGIARILVFLVNYDARGFWIDFLPYFAAVMAGGLGVIGGLWAVERFFPNVRLRTGPSGKSCGQRCTPSEITVKSTGAPLPLIDTRSSGIGIGSAPE